MDTNGSSLPSIGTAPTNECICADVHEEEEEEESAPVPSAEGGEGGGCLVCGQLSHGQHFGIRACRACAAFFRRSVVDGKIYKCRQNCTCTIRKEQRNMCRCCRFQKCEMLGMNRKDVQLNRDPIGQRKDRRPRQQQQTGECCVKEEQCCSGRNSVTASFPSDRTSTSAHQRRTEGAHVVPSNDSLPAPIPLGPHLAQQPAPFPSMSVPLGQSLLKRMSEGYGNFQSSQRSLYTVMYPDNIFAAESYRLVRHSEYVKMEKGCISLMYSMLEDYFPPFAQLPSDLKSPALRAFSARFTHLDQCARSARVFPEEGDSRFALHYGQCLDMDKMELFFAEDGDPLESARIAKDIVTRCSRVVRKIQKMRLRDLELTAMAGIILWNEVALMNVQETERVRDVIFSELHANILSTYGLAETGPRMGAVLALIQDINMVELAINESVIIGRLFNPHTLEVWEDIA